MLEEKDLHLIAEIVKEVIDPVHKELDVLSNTVTVLQVSLENDISRKIDVIGEGHDFLKSRLEDALQMEKKRESMELEMINLKMEIKKIKERLDIA